MIESAKPRFFYGYIIVVVVFFVMTIVYGLTYSFGVFFNPLQTEFGWTRAETSGAYSLYLMLGGFLAIIMGSLNDRFGPRLVLTFCGCFLGLGYLLMSQVHALWQLYLFYGVIIAIGFSGCFVPMLSTVARWFVRRRSLVTGIVVSGIGLGIVVTPLVANWLIFGYGWRWACVAIGGFALVLLVLAAQFLRLSPAQKGQLPDGADRVEEKDLNLGTGGSSLREAIHTRRFWILWAIFFCYCFSPNAIMVHIVPRAIDIGISAADAAIILTTIGGLSIVGRLVLGNAGDKIGNRPVVIICFILMAVALTWLLGSKELWMFYLFAAVFGLGYGGLATMQAPLTADLFGLRAHGAIFGVLVFGGTSGGAVGPLLTGHIFDITGSYHLAFLACIAVNVIGIALVLRLRAICKEGGRNDS